MAEHTLVALRVASREHAHDLMDELDHLFDGNDSAHIIDAAVAYKTDNGHLKIDQTRDVKSSEGALGGGIIGIIAGAMVAGPGGVVVGALAGGALAGLYAGLRDSGMNNEVIKYAGADLLPGQAALLVYYEGADPMFMTEKLRSYDASLIHTNLPADIRDRVSTALTGANATPSSSYEYDLAATPTNDMMASPTTPARADDIPDQDTANAQRRANFSTIGTVSAVGTGVLPGANSAAAALIADEPMGEDERAAIQREQDAIHDTGKGDLPEPHMSDDAYIADNARGMTDNDSRQSTGEANTGIRAYASPADVRPRGEAFADDDDSAMPLDKDLAR